MELAQAFVRDGLPAGNLASQTATDDPNKLLGQPGKYTQRVSFDLPGGSSTAGAGDIDRGAVIEWWPNPADAQVRADYIQAALSASSDLRTEYDLVGGNALLRISGRIAPDLAGQFEAALKRRA